MFRKNREKSVSVITSLPMFELECLMFVSTCKGHRSCSVLGLAHKQGALGLGSYR